jgi:hypothetical protein
MIGLERASIRRLRSGVVPVAALDQLSVGYGVVKATVGESLQVLAAKGKCAPLFVTGEWGTGKSHMLEFMRSAALARGVAHVRVDLNARGAPLNYPQRFYPWVADSVYLGGSRGLRAIVQRIFTDSDRRDSLLRFSWASESGLLGMALRSIILASREVGSEVLVDHEAWDVVAGTDLAPFDSKRTKALERLAAVAKLLRSVGGAGLVVVLDEAETIDQLWNRLSRMGAYETLGALCRMDAAWAVFGITVRFQRRVERDLANGLLSYAPTSDAERFLRTWRDHGYRQLVPPALTDEEAEDLVGRIVSVYEAAYPIRERAPLDEIRILIKWKSSPGRNPRRLIRSVIDALDARRGLTHRVP